MVIYARFMDWQLGGQVIECKYAPLVSVLFSSRQVRFVGSCVAAQPSSAVIKLLLTNVIAKPNGPSHQLVD